MYYPDIALGQLFKDVQLGQIFKDDKTFVDATPKLPIDTILASYQSLKTRTDFSLEHFIIEHFELPSSDESAHTEHMPSMRSHARNHWRNLSKHPQKTHEHSTLIQLPNPYVVPGGRFREMFYWDSYFTLIGLLDSDEDELALGMLNNFAFLIEQYGYIPNGNRSYFLGRSQPPFFASMLNAYANKHGIQTITSFTQHLQKEYLFWMDKHEHIPLESCIGNHMVVFNNGDYLNRYYGEHDIPRIEAFGKETKWANKLGTEQRDGFFQHLRNVCESGWDFSSRWYANGIEKDSICASNIIPVDLNSLLYIVESTLHKLMQHQQNHHEAAFYNERAHKRKALVQHYHFDHDTGCFQDINIDDQTSTGNLSLAMMYPLYAGIATQTQAESVAKIIERDFLMPGGVVTTLTHSGEQWDFPNGWAPLQYIAVQGLMRYRQTKLALEIARRWLALNEKVYREEGKMMEKYNVVQPGVKAGGGEYPNQDGFGWTNGVDLFLYSILDQYSS